MNEKQKSTYVKAKASEASSKMTIDLRNMYLLCLFIRRMYKSKRSY